MTDPPVRFNLWHEPWVRVTRSDGAPDELGIGALLTEAHVLTALADPSPLVVAGAHRLLVAVLQAIYAPQSLDDIAALLRAGQFDAARIGVFETRHAERFELFHPETPFLQTGDVPLDGGKKPERGQQRTWSEPKRVAALFADVPAETNRTHFHHVTDDGHYVCPACCARGLVTIPAFASSGGAGIRPSINGVPPIYVFPIGDTLFQSLALSLLTSDYHPAAADPRRIEAALWVGPATVTKSGPMSAVGYLESLTFPARRMRLYPRQGKETCTQCGAPTCISVSTMLFEMGHWLSAGNGVWDDPFAAFRTPPGRGKGDDVGPKPVRPEAGKALWREYSNLLLAEHEAQLRPAVVRQTARLVDRKVVREAQSIRFRCIGVRTDGKAKFFEWLDEALEAPPAVLTDDDAASVVDLAIARAGELDRLICFTFDRHFRPQRSMNDRVDQRVVRFKTLRARMSADYWQRLAPAFRNFVAGLADETDRDRLERHWVDTLHSTARSAFDQSAAQVGARADALRDRVIAQDACRHQLAIKRKEWIGDQS